MIIFSRDPIRDMLYFALVAQLDRVLPSEGKGRRFESYRVRHCVF